MLLARSSPRDHVLFQNAALPGQNLSAGVFDFGYQAGFEASVRRHVGDLPAIEFRYLAVDGWLSRAAAATNVADPLRVNAAVPVFLVTGRTIEGVLDSNLHSFELNLMHHRHGLNWSAGFRYLELDDALRARLEDRITPAPTVRYDVRTENRLYGVHVGASLAIWETPRLEVHGNVKGGLFGNHARQSSYLDTGLVALPARAVVGRTSGLVEAHVTAGYRLADGIRLQAGYSMLYLTDVLLATEQLNSTNFVTAGGSAANDTYYHGATFGVVFER